ncbi:hypothetical protein [Spirillospora sp. CA-128828]|uniref:hypothetical protein n=1 Tax=Spirillospora sp. CA-128828 TaxID=3240033 RepID=UPI003D93ECA0
MDRDSGNGWFAFLIENKDNLDKRWSTCGEDTKTDDVGRGGGIRQEVKGDARDFAREILDAFLDHLVANRPEYVEYLLYEDDEDTNLRARVWDIDVADADRISAGSSIPEPGTRLSHGYARGLSIEGIEPTSVVTLPADVVRDGLRRKLDERREQLSDPPETR